MAVVDEYRISGLSVTGVADHPRAARASKLSGAHEEVMKFTFEVLAADSNDSVYRVFKDVNPNIIPTAFLILSDTITGSSDWNVGVWLPNLGALVVENCLADALDLSGGKSLITPANGLAAVAIEDVGTKRLYELAGHTIKTKKKSYDIALKGVAVGSIDGTVSGVLRYIYD